MRRQEACGLGQVEGDGATKPRVLGLIHHTHTAAPELFQDAVMGDGRANHSALIAFKKHSLLEAPVQRERYALINTGRITVANSPSVNLCEPERCSGVSLKGHSRQPHCILRAGRSTSKGRPPKWHSMPTLVN